MKNLYRTAIAVAALALLGACSTTPTTTSLLENTRNEYNQAQNNPQVNQYASVELAQARAAMEQTNDAANRSENSDTVDNLAYQTRQKIALAQEVTKKKQAEADVALAAKERDSMRLEQRTNEANQANANAQQAQMTAQMAQADAAQAQRAADDARAETAQAQTRNAALEAQLADLAAKKTERGIIITLGDVLFGMNKSALNPEGMRSAQKLADVLKQNPLRSVLVEGYTDSTGAAAYNQELSARRASAVRDALLQMGIAADRISVRGHGESYPAAANDTGANRQLNRRVEIVLSDDSGMPKQRN
jgi:outer membrane protein OmpA-like peptidoglycan-associated protein